MDTPPAASTHWDAGETLADSSRAHAADAEHLYGYAIRAWPKIGRLAALRSCSKLIQVGRSAHLHQSACVGYQPSRTPAARTSALTESSTSGS
jgi:hypothetical protein